MPTIALTDAPLSPNAQPVGPDVIYGKARIHAANGCGGPYVIDRLTNGAIIDWNSFSIGKNVTVKINQSNAKVRLVNDAIA